MYLILADNLQVDESSCAIVSVFYCLCRQFIIRVNTYSMHDTSGNTPRHTTTRQLTHSTAPPATHYTRACQHTTIPNTLKDAKQHASQHPPQTHLIILLPQFSNKARG